MHQALHQPSLSIWFGHVNRSSNILNGKRINSKMASIGRPCINLSKKSKGVTAMANISSGVKTNKRTNAPRTYLKNTSQNKFPYSYITVS
jgi:hypothetical protein